MRETFIGLALVVTLAGCSFDQSNDQPQQPPAAITKTTEIIRVVDTSAQQAEPAIVALEDSTGKTLSADTSGSIADKIEKVQEVVGKVGGGAAVGSKVPGPWQPYMTGIAGALAALNGLLGTVAVLFRRRQKRAEGAFQTVAEGIDSAKRKDEDAAAEVTKAIKAKAIENDNLADVKEAVKKAV